MSTLKQEILKEVLKGENVLQSYDSGAGSAHGNEGNIYECRFDAPAYDTETGSGITALVGDLRKYSREDSNGDPVTYVVKKANGVGQELVYNADASSKIGKVGDALNVQAFISTTVALKDDEDLLKNENKYFVRAHTAITDNLGGVVDTAKLTGLTTTDAKVFLGRKDLLEESWGDIRDDVFVTPGATTDSADAGQLIFPVINPTTVTLEARILSKKFIGKIDASTTSVAAGTIFYYDGNEAIFDDGSGGMSASASAKGFFQVVGGAGSTIDVQAEANATSATSCVYDAAARDAATTAGTLPVSYILARDTGGVSTTFVLSKGHVDLATPEIVSADKVWTETIQGAAQRELIMNPQATNAYWTLDAAATEPVDDGVGSAAAATAAGWDLTTAEDLEDSDYWNKLSEGFIEDHDVPVGAAGLEGADLGGVYSPLDAAGAAKGSYTGYNATSTPALVAGNNTYRVNEIVSTSTAGTSTPVEVVTEFKHGLEPGDEVIVADVEDGAGSAIAAVNGTHTVGRVGGASGTDPFTFELDGTDLTTLGIGSVPASISKGTASFTSAQNITHVIWGSHNPPTTDQALVYRH
jgi:hypothetical protein